MTLVIPIIMPSVICRVKIAGTKATTKINHTGEGKNNKNPNKRNIFCLSGLNQGAMGLS
ncbi:MAG: hypothetical protein V1832_00390 [Nitrospirota bacterium]